ncbi:hypothetical protein [Acanthamoeba castellanii mimivirus]|uniref:Uncharacterized protein R785 n=5 Tax=Mimivirus TaxID=315393 RepID=YR785_MIMIV|nr:hypothetical protein MIMI_gp0847 [Acanthamoeba polyphaga mimivirus]Q5UPS0.1 RecName: Full=Uncharacterized protein R785 [Acanthamoeba polyphaga mimivirus]AEQ61000.1 hypothetical protein [Acanthamoeba castellanii mamavirus]AHA45043.1 hypothetical protein HIRU_S137 [Hirudovirus strain Sangsue]AHJ40376.1 hypothetical protein [Samba virus]ALR84406.1 hypothetical protein [Niemeyer virus]AMZ03227.1 hypothetical protein [Mimivirus Bombay]EJN40545.1 hypothetical protein lvs_R687 [Acanthamoeba poly
MVKIEIYYYQKKFDTDNEHAFIFGSKSYTKVYEYTDDTQTNYKDILELIFEKFNNTDNPLKSLDNQKIIRNNKLHTSMSVDDIVKIDNNYYIVDIIGFKSINTNDINQ